MSNPLQPPPADESAPVLHSPPRPKRISSPSSAIEGGDENLRPNGQNFNDATTDADAQEDLLAYNAYFYNDDLDDGYEDDGGYNNHYGMIAPAPIGGLLGLDFLPTSFAGMFPHWHGGAALIDRTLHLGMTHTVEETNDYPEHEITARARNGETFPRFCPVPFEESSITTTNTTTTSNSNSNDHGQPPQAQPEASDVITNLPVDVVAAVLSFLSARNIDGLRLVSNTIGLLCTVSPAWKRLCLQTGKLLPSSDVPAISDATNAQLSPHFVEQVKTLESEKPSRFFDLYRSALCVPVDVPDISSAIRLAILKGINTITLIPGVYQERIVINNDLVEDTIAALSSGLGGGWAPGIGWIAQDNNNPSRLNELYADGIDLEVRAADPNVVTTLVHVCGTENPVNPISPTVVVDTSDAVYELGPAEVGGGGIRLTLTNLCIVHSVPGTDIWSSNTAVRVSGDGVGLCLRGCFVTSMSGRGVVVSGGAAADLIGTTIYNCAATGIYIGDEGTETILSRCNIVNNGYGGRPMRRSSTSTSTSTASLPSGTTSNNMLSIIESSLGIDNVHVGPGDRTVVPSGHSGVYVEAASASFSDTLIARSCLTGMTVVRNGAVRLNACDVVENLDDPIAVEDAFLRERAERGGGGAGGGTMVGGVEYGPMPNQIRTHASSDDWRRQLLRVSHGAGGA